MSEPTYALLMAATDTGYYAIAEWPDGADTERMVRMHRAAPRMFELLEQRSMHGVEEQAEDAIAALLAEIRGESWARERQP